MFCLGYLLTRDKHTAMPTRVGCKAAMLGNCRTTKSISDNEVLHYVNGGFIRAGVGIAVGKVTMVMDRHDSVVSRIIVSGTKTHHGRRQQGEGKQKE